MLPTNKLLQVLLTIKSMIIYVRE